MPQERWLPEQEGLCGGDERLLFFPAQLLSFLQLAPRSAKARTGDKFTVVQEGFRKSGGAS